MCPVNAGVNGYGALEENYVLEHYFEAAGRPGVVMVMPYVNDIDSDHEAIASTAGPIERADRKWRDNLQHLARIAHFCRDHHAVLVVAPIPYFVQAKNHEGRDDYQDVLHRFSDRQGALFVDVLPKFASVNADDLYFSWDPHFSPAGHRAVARILYDETKAAIEEGAK